MDVGLLKMNVMVLNMNTADKHHLADSNDLQILYPFSFAERYMTIL